ncbi:cytochrome c3 family protein [Anaerohalosphaera lusitana]|uniref:cytochrome c3 family protein n=1 Tax=Anaerohalosphaera lusitana TaxID=1936003 RepID=UPI00197B2ABE|nr:NapC/NirT family cytochrome c [Anaerohalosphaera lusitana]
MKRIYAFAWRTFRRYGPAFLAGLAFALLAFIGINAAAKPTSASEYCGTRCHEMKVSYRTWELSTHGTNELGIEVDCIECHLPPKEKYFTHMTAKAYAGAKDFYMHYFGPEYDREEIRRKVLEHMPDSRCTYCHDDLLTRPSSSAALKAHKTAINNPDDPENRCVACHESVGHERKRKLFSP